MEQDSARALLARVVDYAGLFPPAGLAMAAAVGEYAAAQAGPDAWMLGRFVLPATRLGEFAAARRVGLGASAAGHAADGRAGTGIWRLSAIVRDGSTEDVAAVRRFNEQTGDHAARIDSIEGKPATPAGIDWLAASFGPAFEVYVELTPDPEVETWLARVKANGLRAKVRTGGLTADAFPTTDALAGFLEAAVRAGVPFKATAGLHHAVRGDYRLTYAPDSPSAPMYGYLNVLLATAALGEGQPASVARALLTRDTATRLTLGGAAVRWDDVTVSAVALSRARTAHLVSFGSCSFREPSDEYRALAPHG